MDSQAMHMNIPTGRINVDWPRKKMGRPKSLMMEQSLNGLFPVVDDDDHYITAVLEYLDNFLTVTVALLNTWQHHTWV